MTLFFMKHKAKYSQIRDIEIHIEEFKQKNNESMHLKFVSELRSFLETLKPEIAKVFYFEKEMLLRAQKQFVSNA